MTGHEKPATPELEKDYSAWKMNMPVDEFRYKFKVPGTKSRGQRNIDFIAAFTSTINNMMDSQKVFSAISSPVEGTAKEPNKSTLELIRSKSISATYGLQHSRSRRPQLERTGEYLTTRGTRKAAPAKAITYTNYHLSQLNRVVMLGLYLSRLNLSLICIGTSGVSLTRHDWTNHHLQLLCEFIERVFDSSPENINPGIVRNTDDSVDTTSKPKLGRRTTIFKTNYLKVTITKEQYRVSRSLEADIIQQVNDILGVIRLQDRHGDRTGETVSVCTTGENHRFEIRPALEDIGTPIHESQTPEQFIIRLYDLLETIECFHAKQLLHRDLSLNNGLFHEPTIADDYKNSAFCSARHLLDPTKERLATESLLIDSEHSANYKTQGPLESGGTPLYQARATLKLGPLEPVKILVPGMPNLIPEALQRYQDVWPERLKQFPPDEADHLLKAAPEGKNRKWMYELRHDVESVFWILLHWSILIRPSTSLPPTYIPSGFWSNLSNSGRRRCLIPEISSEKEADWLDPEYLPMHELLQKMALHLEVDLHWASEDQGNPSQMTNPSYLREVFQREMLNLFKYKGKPFIQLKRHSDNREVEQTCL